MIKLICLCALCAVMGSAITVVIYEVVKLVHQKKDLSVTCPVGTEEDFEKIKVKAIYMGIDGKAHKVWDRDECELFKNGAKNDEV